MQVSINISVEGQDAFEMIRRLLAGPYTTASTVETVIAPPAEEKPKRTRAAKIVETPVETPQVETPQVEAAQVEAATAEMAQEENQPAIIQTAEIHKACADLLLHLGGGAEAKKAVHDLVVNVGGAARVAMVATDKYPELLGALKGAMNGNA